MISSERPAWRQPSLTVGLLPLSNRREQSPELPPQASIWLGSELRVALFAAGYKSDSLDLFST